MASCGPLQVLTTRQPGGESVNMAFNMRCLPSMGRKQVFSWTSATAAGLLMQCVGERAVLNAFSYTGGFSMAALKGGSPHVISLGRL